MCGKMKKKIRSWQFPNVYFDNSVYFNLSDWDREGALFVIFNVLKCVQLQNRGVIEKLKTDLY